MFMTSNRVIKITSWYCLGHVSVDINLMWNKGKPIPSVAINYCQSDICMSPWKDVWWTLKWYVLIFFLMSQGTIYWHPSYGAQRCHKSHNGCLFDVLMTSIWVIRMTSCFGLGRVSHDNHVMSNILYLIPCFDMDLMSIDILYLTWFDVKLTLFDTLHYTNRLSIDIQGRLRSIDLQVSSVTYLLARGTYFESLKGLNEIFWFILCYIYYLNPPLASIVGWHSGRAA